MSTAIEGETFREYLEKTFLDRFGELSTVAVAAPGRVNLIGEHTDYNDGFVLPMALDREVFICARAREDRRVRAYSVDYHEAAEFGLDGLEPGGLQGWVGYVAAVHWALAQEGYNLSGADLVIASNLPQGTGLSSSAALELAVARAACALGGWSWNGDAMALLCQGAENRYVGVNCGVMDQMAVAVGEPRSALFLDCRSLAHQSIPVRWEGAGFVVINSGVRRSLHGSAYNQRRQECELAVQKLGRLRPGLKSLRDADEALLREAAEPAAAWWRRARHVVGEDGRVLAGVEALRAGDAAAFGRLMSASHASLRDDYEVSCPELDVLVEAAMAQGDCLGSRLTGAGFGGCTISLVAADSVDAFCDAVTRRYRQLIGKTAQTFLFRPGQRARVL